MLEARGKVLISYVHGMVSCLGNGTLMRPRKRVLIQGRAANCLVDWLTQLELFAHACHRVEENLRHQGVAVKQTNRAQRLHMSGVRRHQCRLRLLEVEDALQQNLSTLLPREPEMATEDRRNGEAFAAKLLRLLDRVVNRKL